MPRDLCGHFDVVTNIGTVEHCRKEPVYQWQVFWNAIDLCKIGGIVLHQLVPVDMWEDHCEIWYRDGLGKVFASYFGCELMIEERITLYMLNPDVDYICIALRKRAVVQPNLVPPIEFLERIAL
jgi:hypothetical protein